MVLSIPKDLIRSLISPSVYQDVALGQKSTLHTIGFILFVSCSLAIFQTVLFAITYNPWLRENLDYDTIAKEAKGTRVANSL